MANDITYAAPSLPSSPLHLVLAGRTDPGDTCTQCRTRRSPLYVFQYILSGHGDFREEDFYEPDCRAGDFLISHPWKNNIYSPWKKDPWSKVWINVEGPLAGALLQGSGLENRSLFRGASEAGKLLLRIVPLLPEIPVQKADAFILNNLLQILHLLRKNTASSPPERSASDAEKIRDFLLRFLMAPPPSAEEIAESIHLSPAQTIRIFRKHYGTTPYAWLLEAKLQAAENALRETRLPIRETALKFGFRNEYYFSRIFKEKRGLPPGKIRKAETKEFPAPPR